MSKKDKPICTVNKAKLIGMLIGLLLGIGGMLFFIIKIR